MGFLHLPLPDISGSQKRFDESSYTYEGDFSCGNGTLEAGEFALADGPNLTGGDDEARLKFNISLGSASVIYSECEEVTEYPSNHIKYYYIYNSTNMIQGRGLEASCTVTIKRVGSSCSTESSIQIPTNVTAVLDTWWNDCPGCKIVIANKIKQTLQTSLVLVVENIANGSDLCYLLDY
ncbi:hypothetical protein GE061_018387 [Apolygus lucorum]|uniref:Uncharacterized protein n=1 Tax=Apolygus lucorum TaxID=248454 RepID=A0A8S9XFV2_APOLU|nr:hypothetical protein GE061_018387 [Apolygus lucorum]